MGGVAVDSLEFGHFGPMNDRRYMLVDASNRFVTQRSHALLSQFKLHPVAGGWCVEFQDKTFVIEDDDYAEKIVETDVWKNDIRAREKSIAASRWFSEQLDEMVTLVEFDDLERRVKSINEQDKPLMFADGYPLLVCNSRSLEAINADLNTDMAMKRFRPNVVVELPVDLEYRLDRLSRNDEAYLQCVKPCVRCNIPAIDPVTGVYQKDFHKSLKARIRREDYPVFGMNAAAFGMESLHVGDELITR